MLVFRTSLLATLWCATAFAQSPPTKAAPDTPAAAFAKAKRLKAKVTIDAKDLSPKAVFELLGDQLIDGKLGALVVVADPGITLPPLITINAKEETLSIVLARTLKPLGFSFMVVSKEDDVDDGRIRIVKYDPKFDPEPVKQAETTPVTPEDEKAAAAKLETAKALEGDNKLDRAKVLYKYIVKNHPGTKAAAEAKTRLEKLEP